MKEVDLREIMKFYFEKNLDRLHSVCKWFGMQENTGLSEHLVSKI